MQLWSGYALPPPHQNREAPRSAQPGRNPLNRRGPLFRQPGPALFFGAKFDILKPRWLLTQWHLDEMVVSIGGQRMYMWRAVDSEGEVLDVLVQRRRDKAAALKLLRKLLKKQGFAPAVIVTDKLRSYGAALWTIGFSGRA